MKENISEHISYLEATNSPTALKLGINNNPDEATLERMKLVAKECFEKVRAFYGKPIKVNSFYRSHELNKAVKGSKTSQHVKGEAIDLSAGSKEQNKILFDWMRLNLDYDQLIWENGGVWIHVSYKSKGNRKQVLNLIQK